METGEEGSRSSGAALEPAPSSPQGARACSDAFELFCRAELPANGRC